MATGNGTDLTTFETETLRGDIRDRLLTEFRSMQKPWQQMNEEEQERVINAADDIAHHLVRESVHLVASTGFPTITVKTEKFTVKDGIKIALDAVETVENITKLAVHSGAAVLVLASPSAFDGARKPAETDVVGDLGIPKAGPGSPSDPAALEQVGRGKSKVREPAHA